MQRPNYLFRGTSWHEVQEQQLRAMDAAVQAMPGDRLLNTPLEDLVTFFEEEFKIEIPAITRADIEVDQNEVQIDISRDPHRMIHDRSQPYYAPGTEILVHVPFTGEAAAFKILPTTYGVNPPTGEVSGSTLTLKITGQNMSSETVSTMIGSQLALIESCLGTLQSDAASLSRQLRHTVRPTVERRRQKLLADRNLVSGLGFKMKARAGTSPSFPAPEVRRKLVPTLPRATQGAFVPEPMVTLADYEHILTVMQGMAHVMERTPTAFATMDEETLRSHFLVQLNGHYDGQATGETFNYEGKTDILVRSGDKNIFIAECKFWSGPKMHAQTIDQLLSYTAWRDTKVAVVVFSRNHDFSKVLATIDAESQRHPKFKRVLAGSTETVFRYCFAHRDDDSRELFLTVMAFNVPRPGEESAKQRQPESQS